MNSRLGALSRAWWCIAALVTLASCSDTKASNFTGPDAESARPSRRNYPPSAWITTPDNADTVAQGTSISFTGSGNDPEDGNLTGASLVWSSDRDGQIGTGTSFTKSNLSVGAHVIRLIATDSKGATFSHNRTLTITAVAVNQSPSASISAPASGASVTQGTAVSFTGSANDPEDGALSGASLVWTSDRDGQIGTGASFSKSDLSVGAHTITLTARDAAGATAGATRSMSVTTVVANESPTALIGTPANAASYTEGTNVSFTGSGNDAEDGTLTGASLVWTSDRDGQIGTGTSFTRSNLSVGAHLIRLMATDSKGATFSHYRNLTITAAAAQPGPVSSILVSLTSSSLTVGQTTTATVTLRDLLGLLLTGRAVSWSSSNTAVATVNSSGTVTAVGAGTASIRATSEGVTGQSTVTVNAPAPPPPPPSGGSNEPAGLTLISDYGFNCATPSQCESGWYKQEGIAGTVFLSSDVNAPRSSSSVYQQTFTTALPSGSSPGMVGKNLYANNQTIYVAYWMKLSSNWQGHPSSVNKNVFFPVDAYNRVYTFAQGSGTGPLRPAIGLQGLPQAYYSYNDGYPTTATSVNLYPNVNNFTIVRGQWHKYELVLNAGTPGAANGSVDMWVDGVKVMSYTGIMLTSPGGTARWEGVSWSPTWGGAGGVVTSTFFAQMDHMYISGK